MEYLVKFNRMKNAIAEAHKVDEIKLIRDRAEAYRYALIQAKESPEFIRKAEEIKVRAERRAGELLKEKGRKEGETDKSIRSQASTLSPKLIDIGITKNQSSNWQHIADIPEKEFEDYVEKSKDITTTGAIKLAKKLKRKSNVNITELPEDKYDVILADPPWQYDFSETTSREIENKYPTMAIEKIKLLKVPSFDNSVLFLWATAPKIREALEVMDFWGFEYKTHAVWDKIKIGMGYWFRNKHELLLIGTKGKFSPPETESRFNSIFQSKRTKHSKKPDIVYEIIEKMFPNSKRIELFARNKRNGWFSWGNEINV